MKFEPLFLKLLQFLDIQVYFRLKYLHAVVTFYNYLLGISSDEMVIMVWNVDIMFLQYLYWCNCNIYRRLFMLYMHIYRTFCHLTLRKTRFKIALMVYTFVLKEEVVLYHRHICYIFVLKI